MNGQMSIGGKFRYRMGVNMVKCQNHPQLAVQLLIDPVEAGEINSGQNTPGVSSFCRIHLSCYPLFPAL